MRYLLLVTTLGLLVANYAMAAEKLSCVGDRVLGPAWQPVETIVIPTHGRWLILDRDKAKFMNTVDFSATPTDGCWTRPIIGWDAVLCEAEIWRLVMAIKTGLSLDSRHVSTNPVLQGNYKIIFGNCPTWSGYLDPSNVSPQPSLNPSRY